MGQMTVAIPDLKPQVLQHDPCESAVLILHERRSKERHSRLMESLVTSWPIFAGILLAICAPTLNELLSVIKPWGNWLVFPFVELVARPELHLGTQFQQTAPQIMLYLQFPLEGLMAKKFLRGRVTLSAVGTQVMIYHILGAAQLILIWRTLGGGLLR
jgi:hypothetical protein